MSKRSINQSKRQGVRINLTQPKPRYESEEFGPGKAGIIICPRCEAIYYGKAWHHNKYTQRELKDMHKKIKSSLCPVCRMEDGKVCEGFIVFENIPKEKREDMLRLIEHAGERAYKTDVLDRILKIEKKGDGVQVYTSENQLAVKIAKQVQRAFKGKLKIEWAHPTGPVRIFWKMN